MTRRYIIRRHGRRYAVTLGAAALHRRPLFQRVVMAATLASAALFTAANRG